MNIQPCTGCLCCADGKACSLDDDMLSVYDAVTASEYLSFSFPLYFSSMPGPFKNFIDRCNLLWQQNRLGLYPALGQRGIVFATGGSVYREMFSPSMTVISHLMNSLGGKLDRDSSICLGGLDSCEGRRVYDDILSVPDLLSRTAASFLA
jgi:multimeric flavodoxin WrbA